MLIDKIIEDAEKWNIKLSKNQAILFQKYFTLLNDYNKKFNLTSLKKTEEIIEELFLDSFAGFFHGVKYKGKINELLDLGSGAGFPGLPIKIYMPELKLYLLDSSSKKIFFLKKVVEELKLENVYFLHKRGEDYGRGEGRESISWVTARAFAPLNITAEIALPLLKHNGYFLAFKGPNFKKEMEDAKEIIKRCGGKLENIFLYTLPYANKERSLLIFKKIGKTEDRFPRKAGIPQKRPFI